jgi:hypothetical protein
VTPLLQVLNLPLGLRLMIENEGAKTKKEEEEEEAS